MASPANIEKLVIANESAFAKLYTPRGYDYMVQASRGARRSRYLLYPEEINPNFFSSLKEVYNLPANVDPESFYEQGLSASASLHLDIQKGVFPSSYSIGIHNEVEIPHNDPSRRLERVAGIKMNQRKVAEELRWHSLTDLVVTHAALLLEAEKRKTGLKNTLADLHDWVSERLYSGDEGKLHIFPYNSFHDPITNKAVGIGTPDEIAEDPLITKTEVLKGRHVPGLKRYVYSYARLKGVTAVEKLVDYALQGNGVFDPDEIRDMGGIMMVVTGDNASRDILMNRVRWILEGHPAKNGEITEDGGVGVNRGQNQIDWVRLKFPMQGIKPIELIGKSLLAYVNQEEEVGEELSGDGHDAFMRRRKIRLIRAFYPPFIYKPQNIDIEELISAGGEELVQAMKSRRVITTGRDHSFGHRRPLSSFRAGLVL